MFTLYFYLFYSLDRLSQQDQIQDLKDRLAGQKLIVEENVQLLKDYIHFLEAHSKSAKKRV
jgi:hypothetical protein